MPNQIFSVPQTRHSSDIDGVAVINNFKQNTSSSLSNCNIEDKVLVLNNNCNGVNVSKKYAAHELEPTIQDNIPLLQKKRWKSLDTMSAGIEGCENSNNGDTRYKKSLGRSSIKWLFGIFQSNGFQTSSNTSLKKIAALTDPTAGLLPASSKPDKESIV